MCYNLHALIHMWMNVSRTKMCLLFDFQFDISFWLDDFLFDPFFSRCYENICFFGKVFDAIECKFKCLNYFYMWITINQYVLFSIIHSGAQSLMTDSIDLSFCHSILVFLLNFVSVFLLSNCLCIVSQIWWFGIESELFALASWRALTEQAEKLKFQFGITDFISSFFSKLFADTFLWFR